MFDNFSSDEFMTKILLHLSAQVLSNVKLTFFEIMNQYLEIIASVNGKKGILYLDYGNHFVFE